VRVTLRGANCVKIPGNIPQHFPCRTQLGPTGSGPAKSVGRVTSVSHQKLSCSVV
jgi:hypothetical protein